MAEEFTAQARGAVLSGEDSGEGPAVVLLHGLTATRRYVVMGSRSLERSGHRVISYDARGHGESEGGVDPYSYDLLSEDLEAIMDARRVQRAVLAGASMGAHTLVHFALAHPERVGGLVIITPAFDGSVSGVERWDRLAAGLRSGGIDGFVAAYDLDSVDEKLRGTVETVIRQRMARHRDLGAMARALHDIPRSVPFRSLGDLATISVPSVVIASNDAADPEHPQQLGESYAATIPGARLVLDRPGASPVAWQGSQISRVIAEVLDVEAPSR
jgi:pimeloyl-ACP methyl ester carboxylesterase